MGRPHRPSGGGEIFHILNRASSRVTPFEDDEDFAAFERVLAESVVRTSMRLVAYCVMPNHWHLVAWPRESGDLTRFIGWLTLTHSQRWHAHRHGTTSGHVYQGRFKSFPVQATRTSRPSAATSSATPCAPTSSTGPRSGDGAACIVCSAGPLKRRRCCPSGRSSGDATGPSASTSP